MKKVREFYLVHFLFQIPKHELLLFIRGPDTGKLLLNLQHAFKVPLIFYHFRLFVEINSHFPRFLLFYAWCKFWITELSLLSE
jgi:hypothetical protein